MNGIFKYETKQVRTKIIDDIAWFCLKDVCEILEIGNVTDTKNRLESDKFDLIEVVDKLGKKQEMLFITESGLYAVILRSNKPEAKKFRKWVTSEVLPSIRKNGAYMLDTCLDKIHLLEQRIEKLESIFYPHKHKQLLIVGNHISEFLNFYKSNEIIGVPTCIVYNEYLDYCNNKKINAVTKTKFTQTLGRLANLVLPAWAGVIPLENFFGILKQEIYYGNKFYSYEYLKQTIENFIKYYNV